MYDVNQGYIPQSMWSMAAMLFNIVILDIVVINIVMHACPRAIPQAMMTMRKTIHGFPLVCSSSTIHNPLVIGD